jgi:hypothetical protein
MTTAERLRAEGEARGEARASAVLLRNMLVAKFGPLPAWVLDAIDAAEVDQLQDWALRLVTADRLDDVFGR